VTKALETSLKKVAKGTALVLVGSLLSAFFSFVIRIILTRYITPDNYGILSFVIGVQAFLAAISCVGFQSGVPRYISFFKARKDKRLNQLIFSAFQVSLPVSTFFAILLYFLSPNIATFFHNSSLISPLKIIAFSIPFSTVSYILIAIFRGFDDVRVKVYFENTIPYILRIFLLVWIVWMGLSFGAILYAYLFSFIVVGIWIFIYSWRRLKIPFKDFKFGPLTIELLLFSIPLLASEVLRQIGTWLDTWMLGYFKTMDIVGYYNVAIPMVKFISLPAAAMGFIYLPLASANFATQKFSDLKKLYLTATKWVFSLSFPLFIVLFLFPGPIIELIFGKDYLPATIALQLLALAIILDVSFGPNKITLNAIGKTRLIFFNTAFCVFTNAFLNFLLIPPLGLKGAALALITSYIVLNVFSSFEIYFYNRIHFFSKSYLKVCLISGVVFLIIWFFGVRLMLFSNWFIFILILLSYFLFFLFMLFFHAFTEEDVMILKAIDQKIGIKTGPLKKVIVKFLK
jgi:O-antigen/teichoic acid export membrane protein